MLREMLHGGCRWRVSLWWWWCLFGGAGEVLWRALLVGVAVVLPAGGCWRGVGFSIWKRELKTHVFCPCYLVSMLVYFFAYCSFPLLETTIWYNLTILDLQPAKQKHIALLTSPCFLTFKSPLTDFWSLDFSSLRPCRHDTRSIIGHLRCHLRSWTGKRVGLQSWSIGCKVSSTRRFPLLCCCAVCCTPPNMKKNMFP